MKKVFLVGLLLLVLFCLACQSSSEQLDSKKEEPQKTKCQKCQQIKEVWQSIEPFPYVWGGESKAEGGFDCSGAIYYVQKMIQEPVPRTTSKKYHILASGKDKEWDKGECGDWIWWQFRSDRPYGHIGMHIEQPFAWESGSSTGPVKIKLFKGGFWDKRFKASKTP